jgi:hypothetical protein
LNTALEARNNAYKAELERQLANDALCKEFAALADPFSKWISETKDTQVIHCIEFWSNLTNIFPSSYAALEEQLQFIISKIGSVEQDGAKLKDIKECSEKMDAAGITNNKHTTLTLKDVEVQWEQYQAFLERKKKMLEEEIEHQKAIFHSSNFLLTRI